MVDAPSLGTFQFRLEGSLSNLIHLKMSLLTAGGVDYVAFKGPFQPKAFCDSVTLQLTGCNCEVICHRLGSAVRLTSSARY